MAKIFLCRHGQTEWNKDERFRGRKDIPLSEMGFTEAEAVADALIDQGITRVFASPLSRSMRTLAPLAERLGEKVEPLEGAIDMDFGEWEGLPVKDAGEKYPELFETWKHEPQKVTFPGGESLAQVQARAMRAISRLAVEFPHESIAICSHRVVTKLVVLGLFGVGPEKFWLVRQDTACINSFDYNPPDAILWSMNDTHHLDDLPGRLKKDF